MVLELSRQCLLDGVAMAGAAVFGAHRLRVGTIDAAFASWEPAPGT